MLASSTEARNPMGGGFGIFGGHFKIGMIDNSNIQGHLPRKAQNRNRNKTIITNKNGK